MRRPFGLLTAHVARANLGWQQCKDGADVLVIFPGNEGYISPTNEPVAVEFFVIGLKAPMERLEIRFPGVSIS